MKLELTRYSSLEEAGSLLSDWQALVWDSQADVQFTPGWLDAWWKHFGNRRRLSLIAVHAGNRLVAVLPFFTARVRIGFRKLRVAKLAGLFPNFAVFRLAILPDHAEVVWRSLFAMGEELLGPDYLEADVLCMSQLSQAGKSLVSLKTAISSISSGLACQVDETSPHALISLAESFDAYLATMPGRRRSKQRKAKEALDAEGIVTEHLTGQRAGDFFSEFIFRHNAQWHASGRLGHFGDWPRHDAFLREVLDITGAGHFFVQRDRQGRFLSAQLRLVHNSTCVALLTARDTAPDVSRLGIGPYAHFEMVYRLIPEGVRQIDSGVGEYSYKSSLGADMVPMSRILFFRPEDQANIDGLRRWSDLVNLLYYRIWFLKLAPRLRSIGLARGALWSLWRETRL